MFRGISDRFWLWEGDLRREKLAKEADRVFDESIKKKDPSIYAECWRTVGIRQSHDIEWTQNKMLSNILIREATKLHLPTPRLSDEGKCDDDMPASLEKQIGFRYALTLEAMNELRAAIRNEKKARRETVESWLKILGGFLTILTGLGGVLIGLISVWKDR